ncbi:MAG: 50S ribosomal protein L29 [Rikenella sp.]|nr:50S ribosomal protein L29 [Rikenella sp.]
MKTTEIRELTAAEIIERVETEKANLLKAKLNHAVSPAENSTVLKNMRRDIARMLTILREKQTATINK